jgi:hypothetical protein
MKYPKMTIFALTKRSARRQRAWWARRACITHYKNHGVESDPKNGLVIPIAVESLGKMGKIGYKYLCKAAESYEKGYKRSTIKKYWFSKISVALHNAIGESVNIHISEIITGKENFQEDREQSQYVLGRLEKGARRTSCTRGITAFAK